MNWSVSIIFIVLLVDKYQVNRKETLEVCYRIPEEKA